MCRQGHHELNFASGARGASLAASSPRSDFFFHLLSRAWDFLVADRFNFIVGMVEDVAQAMPCARSFRDVIAVYLPW